MIKMTNEILFQTLFNSAYERRYFSPGRINLIGEHIDYNGGYVLPAAINYGTYGYVSRRTDKFIKVYSTTFKEEGVKVIDLSALEYQENDGYLSYIKGVIHALVGRGYIIKHGFNLLIDGNLPHASGLSSSASLELLIAFISNDLYELGMTRIELALLSKAVENDYLNLKSGIMDQFIIACGNKNQAILLDTNTLNYQHVDLSFDPYTVVVLNSNYKRKLIDNKYNQRVLECEEGLRLLNQVGQYNNLCEVDLITLEKNKSLFENLTIYKRVKHVIEEQARVLKSIEALKNKDIISFSSRLNESHESLKTNYEVSGPHLDFLVEKANLYGALGSRMTGAGFGGCAIALIKKDNFITFRDQMKKAYREAFEFECDVFEVTFSDGVNSCD